MRAANIGSFCVLIGWILYDALGRNVFGRTPWPDSVVDYQIMYEQSRKIAEVLTYDPGQIFPYAPPAVLMFALSAVPPFSIAAAIWLALLTASAIGVFVLGTRLVGLHASPVRWTIALLTYIVTNNYFQWDLRSVNCNSVYAVLLVGALLCVSKNRDAWGGAMLAASIAVKLYPVLALPYLAWTKRWRAAMATGAALVVLFLLVPVGFAGAGGATRLYESWFEQLRLATATDLTDHPILISIPHGLAKVFGAQSPEAIWLARGAKAIWVAAVGVCLLSGGIGRNRPRSGWELCVDGFALVLLPVVISPYLESYHAVVAAPPILALLAYGVRDPSDRRRLLFAVLVVLAGWGLLFAFGQWKLRGLGVMAQMTLVFVALAVARMDLRKQAGRLSESPADARPTPA